MPQLLTALSDPLPRAIAGFLLALLVAIVAGRARALTGSGMAATTLVGGSVVAGAGWWTGVILILYFVTSSGLSQLTRNQPGTTEQARGHRRDAWQVAANGGAAAVFSLASLVASHPDPLIMAAIGSIAGAAADTWATELGRFSRTRPHLVTSWQRMPPGTSGAISATGTLASLSAATFIGLLASAPFLPAVDLSWSTVVAIVTLAGLLGSLADSLLGATVQERRWCPVCQQPTERRVHRCGTATVHTGGVQWVTNDVVNFVAVVVAGAVAGCGTVLLG